MDTATFMSANFVRKLRLLLTAEDGFYRKLLSASLLGVLSIALLALVFLGMAVREFQQDNARARTLETLRLTSKAANELAALDTAYRGYSLTGLPEHFAKFDVHQAAATERLEALSALLATSPERQERIREAQSKFTDWTRDIAAPALAASEKATAAPTPATLPESRLMDEARQTLDQLEHEEQALLTAHPRDPAAESPSFQVLVYTAKLESLLSEMENASWSFLVTGDKARLAEYQAAVTAFNAFHGHLSVLLGGTSEAPVALSKISHAVDRWQREAALPEINAKQENRDLGGILARSQGRQILEGARGHLAEIERSQIPVHEKTKSRADWMRMARTGGLALLCTFTIAVLAASGWYSFAAYRRHLAKIETAEAQTRSIIETTLDAIITINDQGLIGSVNPAGERMFGYKAQELIGQSVTKIIPQRLFLHDMADLGRGSMMAVGHRQNYYPFPIEISLSLMDTRGSKKFVALIRDVTERKRSEETLKHIGLGVSATTGEEFVRSLVKQLSKALQSEFAFIVETIKKSEDNSLCTLVIAEHGTIRSKTNYKLSNTACEEALKKGFRAYPKAVCEAFPQDEILRELGAESFLAMPLNDHLGKTVGLMGVIDPKPMDNIEIAESTLQIFAARAAAEIERKRFEEDLAAEKERLAVTLRSIGDGFITTDTTGNVLMINNVAEKLTGWPQDLAINKPLGEIFNILNEHTRKPHQSAIERIIETGSIVGSATHALIVSREGHERLIETSASPIRDRLSRKIGVVLVFRDITERQRLEEERRKAEKLESLGVAAGGIAHDFNNLLTAIIGNLSLSLLKVDGRDAQMAERLNTAKKASLRAQELAQQLLTFAKGGAPIKKTATIGQLIQDTVSFSLRGSNIRGDFSVQDDLWPVDIDQGQISQVIGNLTINAEQAMPAGGMVTVRCENFQLASESSALAPLRPGRYVRITVRDEGIGIPEDYLKKIFDPYFTTKPKGSGLGLATSYSIIKNHDGLITVESKPGSGATFCIYLPASSSEILPDKTRPMTPSQGKGKILVLDDEEVICALVTHALTPLGYDVTEANDPEIAIQLYQEAMTGGEKFNAVISDLTIPGTMGGAEAVKRLRTLDPTVKAIVSSGYANDPVMSRYKEYGFCACIAKPYEISELGMVVHQVLESTNDNLIYHDYAQSQLA
jgi:PAS domain S-box-containing protein